MSEAADSASMTYEKLVEYIGHLVHMGEVPLHKIGSAGYVSQFSVATDYTVDELRDDIRSLLQDVDENGVESKAIVDNSVPETSKNVDWPELWSEFGFDTPDETGRCLASKTQLRLAIDCSQQNVAGNPINHIESAVEEGTIHPQTANGPNDTETLRGYKLGNIGGGVRGD